MDTASILVTDRLYARPFVPEDAVAASGIYGKPAVMRFIPGGVWSKEQTVFFIERSIARLRNGEPTLYAITHRESQLLLGHCGFSRLNTSEIEIAYILDDTHWGKGFGTEIATRMLRYGFETLKYSHVIGLTFADNIASRCILRTIGMREEGAAQYFGHELVKFTAGL